MDKFIIPLNWEIKPFDLKLINSLVRDHPYQATMFLVYKYYCSYIDEIGGDILNDIDYFKLLDRYYRYGITFEDGDCYPEKRLLYEKRKKRSPFDIRIRFEDDNIYPELLYVKEDFDETPPFRYIIRNIYNLKQLLYNDVKRINLNDLDKGPIALSEIEKWKRKVVNQQTDRKTKLRLLDPNIYHSLITFVVFSKFEERPHNKIDYDLSRCGIEGVDRKLNNYKNKYNCTKLYEDKIYNKIKDFLK